MSKANVAGTAARVALGLLALGAVKVISKINEFSFKDEVVIISGGSRGLGLIMARRLGSEGAKLVLLARDETELNRAIQELTDDGMNAVSRVCDITDEQQVKDAVAFARDYFGTIDVLINNAGVIQVGPMDSMTKEDYEVALNTHLWGVIYLTNAVLPIMRENKSGRIVNIASIGANISVPHLLPYCVSKFALRGFSEGISSELRKENIFVTTVCPGLMRTGSHINALFKGQNKKEYALFSISNALPILSIDGDCAGKQIVEACRRGDAELIITLQAQALSKLNGIFPELTTNIMKGVCNFLPTNETAEGDAGDTNVPGWQSQSKVSPSVLTEPADSVSAKNNEI
ncbi:SDR family oxidoreductase [Candidatus Obscuribacterales bacterium]|nr:SDR family oxidoreductase [Candidatus Obscuribacterales bacterium]